MPLTPNQQLFEYRIERILGRGAFGTVYLAHDTLLDRPVAIKELAITAQTDEVAFKRFLQEARAAGGLNHPHVVTVYALKVVEPNVYMVMEHLAGGSLRTLLEQRGSLPVEEAVRIAADVCEGLAAAHAKDIIHRDVKPENILLTEDERAKVGDFGIAHVPRGAGGTRLTQAGFQPGTLIYMSPEQIRGQQVDGRSDVYQVGALLYEMLTGRHYVDLGALERRARETAGSNAALFQARLYELLSETICAGEPEEVCRVLQGAPDWVGMVVAAALAKQIEDRPTAEELARTLRGVEAVPVAPARSPKVPDVALAEERFNRGVAYAEHGRWDAAIREYQAALRINPNYAEAHYSLGMVHRQQGRVDDAIREAELALQFGFEPARPLLAELGRVIGARDAREGKASSAKSEFWLAFNQICTDRNLPREVVLEALRDALVFAYRRQFGAPPTQNVTAQIDVQTGRASIFAECQVVARVSDPQVEISLEQAQVINPDAQLGDLLMVDSTPRDFSSIAAQTAKQVILQRIREAERGGRGVRADVQHFDQDIAYAQQSPLDVGRVFESTQQLDVLGRPRSKPGEEWQGLGNTPGAIEIPPDYSLGIHTSDIDDDALASLVREIADSQLFARLTSLDFRRSKISDRGLPHLKALYAALTDLNLEACEITDEGLAHLKPFTSLTSLNLHGCRITDAGLMHLRTLTGLKNLDLRFCGKITDAGLTHLMRLTNLTSLNLDGCCRITDAGLTHLRTLTGLKSLTLGQQRKITDAGLEHLRDLSTLTDLNLRYCFEVTDAGLAHLEFLPALTTLRLYRCKITDAGLAHLKALVGLASLDIDGNPISGQSQITDAGLVHLRSLTGLTSLRLYRCKITGTGLAYVKGLTRLTSLDLGECKITDVGLAQLKALTGLARLNLSKCKQITDAGLMHLRDLANLTNLNLVGCDGITDAGLACLERPWLSIRR